MRIPLGATVPPALNSNSKRGAGKAITSLRQAISLVIYP
jgi:hypothetical protein